MRTGERSSTVGVRETLLGDVCLLKLLCASREEVAGGRSRVEVGGAVVCKCYGEGSQLRRGEVGRERCCGGTQEQRQRQRQR